MTNTVIMYAAVPRLSTSCTVAPNMNKLPVVGQTPFGGPGPDPQQTPTPLQGLAKPGPLQIYETDRPFFGSTPVGGLNIMTSRPSLPAVCTSPALPACSDTPTALLLLLCC